MKKLLLAVSLLILTFGYSQKREKGAIELTPQIGYASSTFYSNNSSSYNSRNGAAFGVGADYFFNDRWSLKSGLLYQPMGADFYGGEDKINYLTIPVNANWHFGSTRKWYMNFGPSLGFVLSAKETVTNQGEQDIKDLVSTTQLGFNFGIGYKIFINEKVSISIDYQGMTGLNPVNEDTSYRKLRHSYGSFNIGGVIKLDK